MPFLDENKREQLRDNLCMEVMLNVASASAEPEKEQAVPESEDEEEPPTKKPKTVLGELLGMFNKGSEKKRMSIQEEAVDEMKWYLDEPSLDIDKNQS